MITVSKHEKIIEEIEQRHAEKVSVWNEISRENKDNRNSDVKVVKADRVMTSLERDLILSSFNDHVRALQILFDANLKRKMTFANAVSKVLGLSECKRLIDLSD